MNAARTAGLTLVETLISMALSAVVVGAILNFSSQSITSSAQSGSLAQQQQELLNAQQLITGKLREAYYLYPANHTLALSTTNDPVVRNPITGTNTWQNGNAPMLAMILPPSQPQVTCAASTNGCYRFHAYYATRRGTWISGVNATPWRNPGPDGPNDNVWVIAEYRAFMPNSFTTTVTAPGFTYPGTPPAVPTGGSSNILADLIAPGVVTSGLVTSSGTYTMFTLTTGTVSGVSAATGVTMNLATMSRINRKVIRQPSDTDEFTVTVTPENLGKRTVY